MRKDDTPVLGVCMSDGEEMTEHAPDRLLGTLASVVGDAHFWLPVAVLAAGLVLLRWVS
jgi:hypothetical protein